AVRRRHLHRRITALHLLPLKPRLIPDHFRALGNREKPAGSRFIQESMAPVPVDPPFCHFCPLYAFPLKRFHRVPDDLLDLPDRSHQGPHSFSIIDPPPAEGAPALRLRGTRKTGSSLQLPGRRSLPTPFTPLRQTGCHEHPEKHKGCAYSLGPGRRFPQKKGDDHRKGHDQMEKHPRFGRADELDADRKSTRLNSSHVKISYAVFCLKKKKN